MQNAENIQVPKWQQVFILWAISGCVLGGLVHILALMAGPYWMEFLGAPPAVIQSASDGTWLAPVSTLAIASLLFLWSLYGLSALGYILRLPLLRVGNGLIALVLILRGGFVIPYFLSFDWQSNNQILFHGLLSFYVLTIGIGYVLAFCALKTPQKADNT